jgi:hypothetical protein
MKATAILKHKTWLNFNNTNEIERFKTMTEAKQGLKHIKQTWVKNSGEILKSTPTHLQVCEQNGENVINFDIIEL